MRKVTLLALSAAALSVSGCQTSPYGGGGLGGGDLLAGLLGSILNGGQRQASDLNQFERAAANACGREAQQYGEVRLTYVEQDSRDTVRIQGDIAQSRYGGGQFTCTFRSDGRIVDFRTT